MLSAESLTRENPGLELLVAVAYGGRWDLVQACRTLVADAPPEARSRRTSAKRRSPSVLRSRAYPTRIC